MKADIVFQNDAGRPLIVVVVTARDDLLEESGAFAIEQLLEAGRRANYLLVASRKRGLLWTEKLLDDPRSLPAACIPLDEIVMRYVRPESDEAGKPRDPAWPTFDGLPHYVLRGALYQWLTSLRHGADEPLTDVRHTLDRLGFVSTLRQGLPSLAGAL
jgi:hypothetical protein